jgi:iron complex transport system permease protein
MTVRRAAATAIPGPAAPQAARADIAPAVLPRFHRAAVVLAALLLLAVGTALLAACVGSVSVPLAETLRVLTGHAAADPQMGVLLTDIRLPRVATAAVTGAGLAVAGLLMQTLFANPLADPYILGVSSGAGLGVAVVTIGSGSAASAFAAAVGGAGRLGTVGAAAVGAGAVLALVLLLGRWVRSVVALLIIGVMIGAVAGAGVSVLLAFADPSRAQKFVLWGLGSVSGTGWPDLLVLAPVVLAGILLAGVLSRSLNALLLGERYAASMGVAVRRVRGWGITATALIAGSVTAFCGPIAFLGIAVPHLTRLALGSSERRALVPGCVLMGAAGCQVCAVVAQLPGQDGVLPLNVMTAVIGAPVGVAVLLRSRRLSAGAVT